MYNVSDFRVGLIYKYTSPNGKVYIGQTLNEKSRKWKHKKDAENGRQTYFAKAIRKYGFDNFKYEVIIKFNPTYDYKKLVRVLNKLEKRYIKLYNSTNSSLGYNLMTGGENSIHTEGTKQKIREQILSRPEEWNIKLSDSAKKRVERDGYNKSNLENGRGKKSGETKMKMRDASTSKKQVEQYDAEKNLIATFNSISDAARSIDEKYKSTQKTKSNRIGECCNGKKASIYGYT